MADDRIPLSWPTHGVSKDRAHSKQPEQTTPLAKNVRTLQGTTMRAQGGQRPGWRDYLASPMPGKVDALASVTVDLSKQALLGPSNASVSEVWAKKTPSEQRALDVAADFEGNLYVVDPTGIFLMYGPDGEEEARATFHVPSLEAVVPRIQVDENRAVYVATSHPQGYSSRVLRFRRIEVDEDEKVHFVLAWEFVGLHGVRDFRVGGGLLVVARFYTALAKVGAPADVVRIGQLQASEPTVIDSAATPWPVSNIALNEAGEILAAAPANPKRTELIGGETWQDPVESWSPHELESLDGSGASERIHFWMDPRVLGDDHVDGTKVALVPDRRWLHTSLDFATTEAISESDGALNGNGEVNYLPVKDTTARPVSYQPRTGISYRTKTNLKGQTVVTAVQDPIWEAPRFRPNGAGTLPTIQFPGIDGANLRTDPTLPNSGQKSDTDGDGSPNADGIMPLQGTVFPTHGRKVFALFLAIRYVFNGERSGVVFHQRTKGGVEVALVMNSGTGDSYASALATSEGKLSLHIGFSGSPIAEDATGAGFPADDYVVASCDLTAADFANDKNVAIICFQHGGSLTQGVANATGNSLFRVNGYTVDRFTMVDGECPAVHSMFGSVDGPFGSQDFVHYQGGSLHFPQNFAYGEAIGFPGATSLPVFTDFDGDLLQAITVLGSTSSSTAPNEVQVGWPGQPSGAANPANPGSGDQWTDMTSLRPGAYATNALWYAGDAQNYTNAASEIERIEGWLAYAFGCADVLAGGQGATGTGTLQDVHPFGLGAIAAAGAPDTTSVPPVGSPAAGGEVISATGLALLSPKELLFKIGTSGKVQWAINGGGHGRGVTAGVDGAVFAVGDKDGASNVVAKRLLDLGPAVVETGDDTWQLEEADTPSTLPVYGLAADDAGNLYWPRAAGQELLRLEIKSPWNVGSGGQTELTITKVSGGSEFYTFQTPAATTLASNQVSGGSAALDSAINLAAAINANGFFDVAFAGLVQYAGLVGPVNRAQHPDVIASVEEFNAAGNPVVVLRPRAGAGSWGEVKLTISGSAPGIQWEDTPSDLVRVLKGTQVNRLEARSAATGSLLWRQNYGSTIEDVRPLAVAVNPVVPFYDDEDKEGTAEFLYVAFQNDHGLLAVTEPRKPTLRNLSQIERQQVIDEDMSPRRTVNVGVSRGSLYLLEKDKAPAILTSGKAVLQDGSPFVRLFPYQQKLYGLDGQNYIVYDPKRGTVKEWKAEGAGKIPYGAKLGVEWNGRIVLARTAEDPHNLHMSVRGNPLGWNTSPVVVTPLSAFSGSASGSLHFSKHDLVTCLIAWTNDLLIVGGDQSIMLLRGDPGGGGELDVISRGEGLAFGEPWAMGPDGSIYAKGTNGGVWRFAPGGAIDRVSLGWVERDLQDIDLKTYDVRMLYSFRQEGVHVFQVPKLTGEVIVPHWFYDTKEVGWWPDEFSSPTVQPTCVATFDGDDPDDRMPAIGCEDGQVRVEDSSATSDGSHRIESEVLLGPIWLGAGDAQVVLHDLEVVLASRYNGCDVQVFASDVADFDGGLAPVWEGHQAAGYTGLLKAHGRGNFLWVKLRNGAAGETFALESLTMGAREGGQRRRMS